MYFSECTKPNLKKPILQLSAYWVNKLNDKATGKFAETVGQRSVKEDEKKVSK
jgi:hypothetical protein